jgi:transposase-like protein
MSESTKEPVRCPKCGSTDVRYSYTQGTWDMIVDLLFSMDAFRCRSCRSRFHKFDAGDRDDERLKDPEQEAARGLNKDAVEHRNVSSEPQHNDAAEPEKQP